MIGDTHCNQFLFLLQFFAFAMNVLVISNNMVLFFFCWELVGLCSYCLISFWKTNQGSHVSSIKAVI